MESGNKDYRRTVYSGKKEQMAEVCNIVKSKGFIPTELVETEVLWFYENLGIDDYYFILESSESISTHILALYASKIQAFTHSSSMLDIELIKEHDDGAVYMCGSKPGLSTLEGKNIEKIIDKKYLDNISDKSFRLESYRSAGNVSSNLNSQLRCYFIQECKFTSNHTDKELSNSDDIKNVSDIRFLEKATDHTLNIYQKILISSVRRQGPVIEIFDIPNTRKYRVVIGYHKGSVEGYFSALSDLYHFYDMYSTRKYVEQFSNGITIICLYLKQLPNSKQPPIEVCIHQIKKEASLLFCIPETPFQEFFKLNTLSVQEAIYGYVCWIFSQHFLNRLGTEFSSLIKLVNMDNPQHSETISKIKRRLRQETFTREYIMEIIKNYPNLIKDLYINFAMTHYISSVSNNVNPSISYQRINVHNVLNDEELTEKIRNETSNLHEFLVFSTFQVFNKHVLKTNFFQPTKVALSFRLDPGFLPDIEYPTKLFGMFFIIGSEFRGFHLRFQDVARGGIRVIKSRNREAYSINLRNLFDENYGLAATQQRKNKDIPEGGSKGTILLHISKQNKAKVAFEKYVDSILDLIIQGNSPGIKEKIVDLYEKKELLFFGPDEGTAEYMDWASLHAKRRGAKFWKAFTTGKSQSLGGIPHDIYGMTTRSVHKYVLGLYEKLNINENDSTKLQTGGPDGDLGSNEIKISNDKTIAIVDGSGVLYDPNGIDREELLRLANNRLMINEFNTQKVSENGFRVLIDDKKITLPDKTVINDGLNFRNTFHLSKYAKAVVFVPCGGRPESVDINNFHMLLNENGTSKFKFIVEGANLFFTQEARLRLEEAGCILIKDASANKGGVTSSSLEVLAALAFDDDMFENDMQIKNGIVPEFYNNYVKDVHRIIESNATLEFECLWKEANRLNIPISILSDKLSIAINKLNEELQNTSLYQNEDLRRCVLNEALPDLLTKKLGLETILKKVPDNYLKSFFGCFLASRFIYKYGINPSQFAFFEFMAPYFNKVGKEIGI